MNIVLDCRERSLHKAVQECIGKEDKFSSIEVSTTNLIIGDILIGDDIIIERKTVADLLASIKDKRYVEQSFRLDEHPLPNHNIIYLIEGTVIQEEYKQIFYSSLFSINQKKGFSLYRSTGIEESAYIICNMALNQNKEEKKPDYTSLIAKKKSSYITKDNIDQIMLSQIPSISENIAKAVLTEFGGLKAMIDKLSTEEGVDTLKKIKVGNRTIGKNCVSNLILFLSK